MEDFWTIYWDTDIISLFSDFIADQVAWPSDYFTIHFASYSYSCGSSVFLLPFTYFILSFFLSNIIRDLRANPMYWMFFVEHIETRTQFEDLPWPAISKVQELSFLVFAPAVSGSDRNDTHVPLQGFYRSPSNIERSGLLTSCLCISYYWPLSITFYNFL